MHTRTRGLVAALALGIAAIACAPTKPLPPLYATCQATGTYQCFLWTTVTTSALGIGQTTGPATFISIELTLEQRQADGSYTGFWVDRSGAGTRTQRRVWSTAIIHCKPGYYRWYLRVQFTGVRTTYSLASPSFYVG